ncbi:reverse transcriptase [Cucumis melo var. makuwa]|uniref:Reverse transcriptase n=1 Tax=Cucumis melo var. makuwa TaxID=1194695 RepID=A0A5D3D1A9_CUCMM|nr:reverse transcriptase [Cucumis melo var. makuwa]TYK17983.1 reverse transcriptase [Cucumis melo var. makuwa]
MMEGPVLGIADVTKPFEVETDAFHYALGGVLLQNGHPIAQESRKLNVIEKRAGDLRKKLLHECHNTLWADHPGWQQMCALLKKGYFWRNRRDDVMQYTKTCLISQQNKVEKSKVVGLLDPLPVPIRPWESVYMDFITHLPKAKELGPAVGCSPILFQCLESSSTRRSLYKNVSGRQPVLSHLVNHPYIRKNPQAHNFMKEWKQTTDITRAFLEKASRRMKKWADKKRRLLSFEQRTRFSLNYDQNRSDFRDAKTSASSESIKDR